MINEDRRQIEIAWVRIIPIKEIGWVIDLVERDRVSLIVKIIISIQKVVY